MATIHEALALARENRQAGRLQAAEQICRQILTVEPAHAEAHNELGVVLVLQGQLPQAAASFQRALQLKPDHANAYNNLGNVLKRQSRLPEAVASYRRALELQPDYAEAYVNLGDALSEQGQVADAIASYEQALKVRPNFAGAYCNLGNALKEHGQLAEAAACYERALELQPDHAEALNNLGVALMAQGQAGKAIPQFQRALQLMPDYAGLHNNLGAALKELGDIAGAIDSYRRAIQLQPNYAEAHLGLGMACQLQGRLPAAITCFQQALRLKPDFAEARHGLGTALLNQGRLAEAIACLQLALRLKPDFAEAHRSLGAALSDQGQIEEAIACYRHALQCNPDNSAVLGELVHHLQSACLWSDLPDLARRLLQVVERDASSPTASVVSPLTVMALLVSTTQQQQLECARRWGTRFAKCSPLAFNRPSPISSGGAPHKIAIGYLSADFHAHATAYLIAELIEKHDRDRFAVFGYSYGPVDDSPIRQRLVKAFDRFVEIRDLSFPDAARQIAADGVDILVDLKGYTRSARTEITALRPAPIQVNYLGYPGTMAVPFVDYILVDDFIAPPDQQPFFTEKLVHLPGCYQVNDSRREISPRTPTRAECALPESGFIFCCFNNSWKITPEMFDVWMRLLKAAHGSVLWLLESNRFVAANLRKEAQAREVSPDRLVFAPHVPLPNHLARHRLADLALDTIPYNAHTTASDALWAGCPLLTIAGQTFPSRVAGSLLWTIGLPELITNSIEEYYDMALRLARDSELLANIRSRLQANRNTTPLFYGGVFARNFEKAFYTMWQIHTAGEPPRAFVVETC